MEVSRAIQRRPRGAPVCLVKGADRARGRRLLVWISGSAGGEGVHRASWEVGELGELWSVLGVFGGKLGSDWAVAAVFLTALRPFGGVIADHSIN